MADQALSRQAADWVARLGGQPGEAEWLAFEAWLGGDERRRAAYDHVLALSLAVDRDASTLADDLTSHAPARRSGGALWGAGLMSLAAVAVTFAALHPRPEPKAAVYATAKGERRDVVLSDGTRIALSTDTRLSVIMRDDRRELTLSSGEAAFQVAHNAARPFVVHLGDRVLRDIGTEFDAVRRDGLISVTVREGMVSLERPQENQRRLTLGPGSRAEHREGSEEVMVAAANADETFSWRSGRLIYRNRPLSDVVADINRYGDEQVKAVGPAADLKFTGVLTTGDQSAMVQRLAALLPVAASSGKDGVILLSELNSSR
ncbi:MAG: FecR family protein [Caulobacteraceae bacterium]